MTRYLMLFGIPALVLTALATATRAEDAPPTSDREKVEKIKDLILEKNSLEVQILNLKHRVEQLEAQQREQAARIAKYVNPAPPPPTGMINLRNNSNVEVVIAIDSATYRLAPGQPVSVVKPLGNFEYEVSSASWGVLQPRVGRTLIADRPFAITVNPPPATVISAYPGTIILP